MTAQRGEPAHPSGLPTAPDGGWIGGFGNVGVGIAGPPFTTFPRPDLCAGHGHPGVTYNPWMRATWCLCGARVQPGDHVPVTVDRGLTQWWPDRLRPLLQNPQRAPKGWRRAGGTYCLVADRPEAQQLDLFEEAA